MSERSKPKTLKEVVDENPLQEIIDELIERHCFSPVVEAIVENLTEKLDKANMVEQRLKTLIKDLQSI